MKKILLVLAVLALGTLASAQTFGFGTSIGGTGLYCNYEQLVNYGGGLYSGYDNLSPCGGYWATIAGFQASVPNVGPQAHGAGVVYGDDIYQVYNGYYNDMWTVFTKLKCNKQDKFGRYHGTDSWEGVAGFSGFLLGTNQGPLSCNIPGKNGVVATKGASITQKK